jgi:hypothetical protein
MKYRKYKCSKCNTIIEIDYDIKKCLRENCGARIDKRNIIYIK